MSSMTADQWQRVKELFDNALALAPEARLGWLAESCDQPEIRREVESLLLSHDQAGEFIQHSAAPEAVAAMADIAPDSRRGEAVGPWRLVEEIGHGGMGTVWRAERADGAFEKTVAVKVVSRGLDTDLVLRYFHRERQILASLSHTNITALLDGGTTSDGLPYFVMEYVEGSPITAFCRDRTVSLRARLELFCTVCDAVAYAHRNHVLHRDLKPSNILVTTDGVPKLLDFGIAKLLAGEPGEEATLTAGPLRMLTPEYASPEQVRAEPLTGATDVYSLGVLLYELVADRRPYEFTTRSPQEFAELVCARDPAKPSAASGNRELKGGVDGIVMMALRKEPQHRYASIDQLAADVRRHLAGEPVRAARQHIRYNAARLARRHGARLGGTLAALTAIALAWHYYPRVKPPPTLTRLTSDSGLTTDPALSPDGKLLAYASDRGGNGGLDIWVQPPNKGEARRLTATAEDDHMPSFSPDGMSIAFERDGAGIHVVPITGGAPTRIASEGRGPRFSPNGKWIAYWVGHGYNDFSRGGASRIHLVPALGGASRQLQPEFASSRFPIWTPDGEHVLFLGSRERTDIGSSPAPWDWWVAPIGGGAAVRTGALAELRERGLGNPVPGDWTSDGRILFAATRGDSANIWQIEISPTTWQIKGRPQQLTFGTGMEHLPAAGAGGQVVFSSLAMNIDIWSLPLDHGRGEAKGVPRRLTESATMDAHPALSADGRRLAYVSMRAGNADVWLKDLRTGEERAITTSPKSETHPTISADSTLVAYREDDGPTTTIQVRSVDNPSRPSVAVCGQECFLTWDWSLDAKHLLYWSADQNRIGLLNVGTGEKAIILQHPSDSLLRADLSPDGRWIAFVRIESAASEQLHVAPFQGMSSIAQEKWTALGRGRVPTWSPDGNAIYFISGLDGGSCVWRQRLDPAGKRPLGRPRPVFHSHGARLSISGVPIPWLELSVARDFIVFPMNERTGSIWRAEWNQ